MGQRVHAAGWNNLHDLTTPPDGTCATCHDAQVSNVLPGHYGDTVRTAGNNMTVPSTIVCTSCHDASSDNHTGAVTLGNGSNLVTNKIYANWPNITCDHCHENRASLHATGTAHNNRIIDSTCDGCHTSDTSVLGSTPGPAALSSDADVDTLPACSRSDCTLCHNYTGTKLDAGIVRQAIQQGLNGTPITCTGCHTDKTSAHGSVDHVALGYVTVATSCSTCHDPGTASNATVSGTHLSNCALCHTTVPNLKPGLPAGGGDCAACHTSTWEVTHTLNTPNHNSLVQVATTICSSCHSDPPPLTDAVDPRVHNGCSSCHNTDGSLRSLAVGQNFISGGNCATCHASTLNPAHTEHTHTVGLGSGDLSNGTSCDSCHVVANWSKLKGLNTMLRPTGPVPVQPVITVRGRRC